jgi:hypothetical protein
MVLTLRYLLKISRVNEFREIEEINNGIIKNEKENEKVWRLSDSGCSG